MSGPKLIDKDTALVYNSALNLFGRPSTDVSIVRSFNREVLPQNSRDQHPLLFILHNDNLWFDLSRVYMHFRVCMEKESEGKWIPIDATDTLTGVIDSLGQTFWQQVKLAAGTTEIYDGKLYHYKTIITNQLSFPQNTKANFLQSIGHYPSKNHNSSTDTGFGSRCAQVANGRTAEFFARLDFDLGNQELYMINNMELLFTLYRAPDKFRSVFETG